MAAAPATTKAERPVLEERPEYDEGKKHRE
jgi:hypothetical protein